MTSIPIPFISAFFLLLLAASNHHQLKRTATGRIFEFVLYMNALSLVCIGFRWSHDLKWLLPIAAVLTVISIALLYLAFRSLGRPGRVIIFTRDWLHLIAMLLVVVVTYIEPHWIDFLLIAIKVTYAGLLIRQACRASSSLQLVRLNLFRNSLHALWSVAILLLLSSCIDAFIAIDFTFFEGSHSARLVGVTNMIMIIFLGWASVMAAKGRGHDAGMDASVGETVGESLDKSLEERSNQGKVHAAAVNTIGNTADNANDGDRVTVSNEAVDALSDEAALLEELNALLIEQRLYSDPDLNLQKLGRKAGVPIRVVSRAINSQAGVNVSQWINSARIEAACIMLKDSGVSVTQAMLEAGFTTKSNFNREFKRLKGCSPSQWRSENS